MRRRRAFVIAPLLAWRSGAGGGPPHSPGQQGRHGARLGLPARRPEHRGRHDRHLGIQRGNTPHQHQRRRTVGLGAARAAAVRSHLHHTRHLYLPLHLPPPDHARDHHRRGAQVPADRPEPRYSRRALAHNHRTAIRHGHRATLAHSHRAALAHSDDRAAARARDTGQCPGPAALGGDRIAADRIHAH
jgi:hypothetical protein